MYKVQKPSKSKLEGVKSVAGERIEQKMQRILHNKEPITDGAPQNFTEVKDGVRPEFDIRTDRWDIAVEAMDGVHKNRIAKREEAAKTAEGKADGATEGGEGGKV